MQKQLNLDHAPNQQSIGEAIDLSIHNSVASLRDEWIALEKKAAISVYQRYEWTKSFLDIFSERPNFEAFIVVGRLNGEIVFILPLALQGRFIRRLSFVGGTHVNFNIGLVAPQFADLLGGDSFARIYQRLRRMVPGVGYFEFCCQPETWLGKPNPLVLEPRQRSGNPAYVLNLEGGFAETLARGNGKRKRKKFRQQVRFCEQFGGYEFASPQTPQEIDETVNIFCKQKSRRLREMGVRDVFGSDETREFFKKLAQRSTDSSEPLLKLYTLKVKEEIVAVFGGGFHDNRFSGYFSSIAGDEWSQLSPGEMLLYLLVEHLCERGCVQMDLGAGDERYKQSWSSERIEMYETLIPFNATAVPIIGLRKLYGFARRKVREDEKYWQLYKKIRRLRACFKTPKRM